MAAIQFSYKEWSQANEHLATVVVPQVLSASSVDEKNLALCEGIYSYFSRMYGVWRKERKWKKKGRKSVVSITDKLKEERN